MSPLDWPPQPPVETISTREQQINDFATKVIEEFRKKTQVIGKIFTIYGKPTHIIKEDSIPGYFFAKRKEDHHATIMPFSYLLRSTELRDQILPTMENMKDAQGEKINVPEDMKAEVIKKLDPDYVQVAENTKQKTPKPAV